MSLRSTLSSVSVAVAVVALTALQGCAGSTTIARSSAADGATSVPGLGGSRADGPRAESRQPAERRLAERPAHVREPRSFRIGNCRTCGTN